MEALADFEVEQVVFTSSLLVVRPAREEEVLDESSAVGAAWDCPKSKLDSERVLRERAGDTPIVVLRVAGVYDEDCRSVPIAQQMRRIFERRLESYFFPDNPDHGQSFVHLDDLVRCIGAAVEHRADLGPYEVFLVGEPDLVSYAEMQDVLGQLIHHREWPTIRIPASVAKAGAWIKEKAGGEPFIKPWMIDLADAHRPISIHKAEERLEWRPRHRLRDTLPEMTSRLIVNPSSWYEKNGIGPSDDFEELQARRPERARERVRQGG
jgi:nucleoside-diphosphate-sugar epimerase